MPALEQRFWPAIAAFAILAILAFVTLSGPIRGATLALLAGLAVKTWIALVRHRQEQAERSEQASGGSDDARAGGSR